MSYCRLASDSDVYMFFNFNGFYECCGCQLLRGPDRGLWTDSRGQMIDHLEKHRTAGHKVPEYVFEWLRQEIAEHGDKAVAKSDDADEATRKPH